jgi:hypothetical protein
MGKRFTETSKWDDSWFVELSAENKLAWLYCCDCCDQAGVLDLSPRLANFRIGCNVDWDSFVKACGDRVAVLPEGKLWLVGFIGFQYGELSRDCKAHAPVFRSFEKHQLQRVSKGYPKGIHTLKDKEKEKEEDGFKEGCGEETGRKDRPTMAELAAYCAERGGKVDPEAWMDHYTANGWRVGKNPMRDWRSAVRQWERSEFRNGSGKASKPVTFGQQRQQNTMDLLAKLQADEAAAAAGGVSGFIRQVAGGGQ